MHRFVRFFALALAAVAMVASFEAQAGEALDQALGAHCGRVTCTIQDNAGGDVAIFQAAAREVIAEGRRIVIDGMCASACVVMADLARANTCLTVDARMAVHKASVVQLTGTTLVGNTQVPVGRLIRREDPPQSDDIDRWVYAHGGYPSDGVMIMPVRDARKFWSMC